MARPISLAPTISPYLRGTSLSIRLSYRGIKYLTPVLIKGVQASHQAKNGYLNTTYPDYIAGNEKLAAATTCLENAIAIIPTTELSEASIRAKYLQLHAEAIEAAENAVKKEVRKQKLTNQVKHIDAEYSLPEIEDEIEELELLLISKKKERDTIKKFLGLYVDDSLITPLESYRDTKASKLTDTTKSSFTFFIETVKLFDATAKIESVGEAWLQRFQDWMILTPAIRPVYSTLFENGKRIKGRGKWLYDKKLGVRKNTTILTYINSIKTVLNYYSARPELLPAESKINDTYKRYEFDFQVKEDNVVSLEEFELFDLFQFHSNYNYGFGETEKERAIDVLLFLCSTSLRVSDFRKVTPSTIKHNSINLTAKKTKKHNIKVSIPPNPISTYILEKYNYDMRTCKIHYSQINRRIREVLNTNANLFPTLQTIETISNPTGKDDNTKDCKRADLIGTHSGRRTYVNISLDYHVPVNKIMGATGHTNVATLMIYANKRENVNQFMKNTFQFNPAEREDYKLIAQTIESVEAQ